MGPSCWPWAHWGHGSSRSGSRRAPPPNAGNSWWLYRSCRRPHPLEACQVVLEQPAARHPPEMDDGVLRGGCAVDMGVDEHVLIEPVERVVEGRGVCSQLDAAGLEGGPKVALA